MAIEINLRVPLSWIRDKVGDIPEKGIIRVSTGNTIQVEDESGMYHPLDWETINLHYTIRLVKDYEE